MPRIYLVRHAETIWTCDGRFQGTRDVPLSPAGRRQAIRLARAWSDRGVERVYCSPLLRAKETAEVLAAHLGVPLVVSPAWRELDFGRWEGLRRAEVAAAYPQHLAAWRRGDPALRLPGGERYGDFVHRVTCAFGRLASRLDAPVAVISHGQALRAVLSWVLGLPPYCRERFALDCASVSAVEREPDRQMVLYLNDTSHLRLNTLRVRAKKNPTNTSDFAGIR